MIRYTEEQKTQALEYMKDNGAQKTKEKYGISIQTLYQWRGASGEPKAARKRGRKVPAEIAALLATDGGAVEKITQLEKENIALRALNEKLKKALQSFID